MSPENFFSPGGYSVTSLAIVTTHQALIFAKSDDCGKQLMSVGHLPAGVGSSL